MPHLFSRSREIRYYNMCLPCSLSRWEQLQSRLFPSPPALGHQHVLLFQLLSSIIFLLKRYMNLFIFSFMLFCAVERTCRVSVWRTVRFRKDGIVTNPVLMYEACS